jgi:hypothetical protein
VSAWLSLPAVVVAPPLSAIVVAPPLSAIVVPPLLLLSQLPDIELPEYTGSPLGYLAEAV